MAEGAVVQNDRCPFAESKYAVMASLAENAVSLDFPLSSKHVSQKVCFMVARLSMTLELH